VRAGSKGEGWSEGWFEREGVEGRERKGGIQKGDLDRVGESCPPPPYLR